MFVAPATPAGRNLCGPRRVRRRRHHGLLPQPMWRFARFVAGPTRLHLHWPLPRQGGTLRRLATAARILRRRRRGLLPRPMWRFARFVAGPTRLPLHLAAAARAEPSRRQLAARRLGRCAA